LVFPKIYTKTPIRSFALLYLHVGLHKTATTYFQANVFPYWKGVRYLRNLSVENFLKAPANDPCLASREGFSGGVVAHQAEKLLFLKRLSRMFPDARILISFRQHASYINAIYSQYLRYGGTLPFSEFFNLDHDNSLMKQEDFHFKAYVDAIEGYWERPPFVFLLTELKENKQQLMNELGEYFGCPPPDLAGVSPKLKNQSLGAKQAKTLRRVNHFFKIQLHRDGSTRPYKLLRRFSVDPPALCQRWSGFTQNPHLIIEPNLAKRIDRHFAKDWAFLENQIALRRRLLET